MTGEPANKLSSCLTSWTLSCVPSHLLSRFHTGVHWSVMQVLTIMNRDSPPLFLLSVWQCPEASKEWPVCLRNLRKDPRDYWRRPRRRRNTKWRRSYLDNPSLHFYYSVPLVVDMSAILKRRRRDQEVIYLLLFILHLQQHAQAASLPSRPFW